MAVVNPPQPTDPDPSDIQGNLVGFNKDHQRLVFINFPSEVAGKALLQSMLPEIATADAVTAFNAAFKALSTHDKSMSISRVEAVWLNVVLSPAGLVAIGAPGMDQMPVEFTQGMAAAAAELGDAGASAPQEWLAPYAQGGSPVHAIAILAADDPDDLQDAYTALQTTMKASGVSEIAPPQDGNTRPGSEKGLEHFGFKDGISQPGILGITESSKGTDTIPTGEFLIGYPDQDGNTSGQGHPGQPIPQGQTGYPGTTPATPTLPPWTHNGSFVCYRRLRQDVAAFQQFVGQAQTWNLTPPQLGAKLLGRWQSGAPMEAVPALPSGTDPSAADPSQNTPTVLDDDQINAFDFSDDPAGNRVPIPAHIRRTNPRASNPSGAAESNRHRILRRGIPYGPEFQPSETPYSQTPVGPDRDRGLLFLCYQADLARGFIFVQQSWANNPDFQQAGAGHDPVIGQTPSGGDRAFTLPPQNVHLTLAPWVTTTGGEFFFSPSVAGLSTLAGS